MQYVVIKMQTKQNNNNKKMGCRTATGTKILAEKSYDYYTLIKTQEKIHIQTHTHNINIYWNHQESSRTYSAANLRRNHRIPGLRPPKEMPERAEMKALPELTLGGKCSSRGINKSGMWWEMGWNERMEVRYRKRGERRRWVKMSWVKGVGARVCEIGWTGFVR